MPLPIDEFRTVRRGYDPEQVDVRIAEMQAQIDALRLRIAFLESRRDLAATSEPAGPVTGLPDTAIAAFTQQAISIVAQAEADAAQIRAEALQVLNRWEEIARVILERRQGQNGDRR